ncbi:sigma-54-dependent transcriptional regulator [Magnetococcus sp. PR-3]|uniref:sigma-54-dependent transcriptional regulator n=1 Tax=Magnetococcus sp. PR-3 TaxID=3120355 RepID=UPI002FCDFFBE
MLILFFQLDRGMAEKKHRILIVDDERLHINMLNDMLKERYLLKVALKGVQAIDRAISDPQPDLILLDIQMPNMDGFQVLAQLKADARTQGIPVIFVTAMDEEEDEARGLELGAVDYITKPFSPAIVQARIHTHITLQSSIRETIEAQWQAQSLQKQVGALSRSLAHEALQHPDAFTHIVTTSQKMRATFHYMEAVADSGEPALITGETGVGKELIAQGLHHLGGRSGQMVSVNLAGLDDTTFSDTLFGHKKGAFTGADRDRKGIIQQARGGTLFLDEIGDLDPASQIKLLRLLQEKLYYPLGSDTPTPMDVTIVAATNRDLNAMMQEGSFRQDLFFRLSAHHIKIPPLRERQEDIPLLTLHFLKEAAQAMGRNSLEPPMELLKLLELYDFPGNIRELRAMIFDAAAQHGSGSILSMKSIQKTIEERRTTPSTAPEQLETTELSIDGRLPTLEEAETLLVAQAMHQAGNNQGIAAGLLGISRTALNRRLSRKLRHLKEE